MAQLNQQQGIDDMWTRGKDQNNEGKFAYELFDANGSLVERVGKFDTAQAADRAAEIAQRGLLFAGASFISASGDNMSLDEIMAELDL